MNSPIPDSGLSPLSYAAGLSLLMLTAGVANFLPGRDTLHNNAPEKDQIGEVFMEVEAQQPEVESDPTPEQPPEPELSELLETAQAEVAQFSELPELAPLPEMEENPLIEALPEPVIKPKPKPTPPKPKTSKKPTQSTKKTTKPAQKTTKPAAKPAAQPQKKPARPAIQVFRGGGRNFPQPSYPRSAQQRKQQGTVTVYVEVNAQGRPTTVTIHRSSGHRILDREAQKTIKRWRWGSGPARYHVPVSFQLR